MRRGLLLLGLVAAGCAELGLVPNGVPPPPPPKPRLRDAQAVPATFGAALIGRRRVDGLTLEVMTVGFGEARGNLLSELKSPQAKLKPPVLSFLIKHPKEGNLLFGAGLPEDMGSGRVKGSALSPFKVDKGQDIASVLRRRGVATDDIRWIFLPDLAPEWAGGAGRFSSATIVVTAAAWASPRRRPLESGLSDPRAFVPEERLKIKDISQEPPFGPFPHGWDVFGDGTVFLVDLEGGAAGGAGLWVNLDSSPVLLTGPAAFVWDNVYDDALPDRRFVVDVSSFAWNARAMRMAVESIPRLVILPAHDLAPLKLSPRPDMTLAR
ncbi:MAG: hypothetical protein SF051_11450 [Elusimicrobiota bacterium]|nr:hypothetical protein [Elusimicrobiota bacterium]